MGKKIYPPKNSNKNIVLIYCLKTLANTKESPVNLELLLSRQQYVHFAMYACPPNKVKLGLFVFFSLFVTEEVQNF